MKDYKEILSEFELMIAQDMLELNLCPTKKEDIEKFWKDKLPEETGFII